MDSRSRFRPRHMIVEARGDRGTKGERLCGWPSKGVGGNPETRVRGSSFGEPESSGVDTREKPRGEVMRRPYRKPTQVGEASSLR